ncbi:hypothetical protein SNEBB_009440 [Seison nebaliae]|nr:hypothetical protein SNEBB_009440 [Seison nebaliae]
MALLLFYLVLILPQFVVLNRNVADFIILPQSQEVIVAPQVGNEIVCGTTGTNKSITWKAFLYDHLNGKGIDVKKMDFIEQFTEDNVSTLKFYFHPDNTGIYECTIDNEKIFRFLVNFKNSGKELTMPPEIMVTTQKNSVTELITTEYELTGNFSTINKYDKYFIVFIIFFNFFH